MMLDVINKTEYEDNLLKRILGRIEYYGGNKILSSVILTGSFGRGEPSYTMELDGSVVLKSDIEIVLVFPKETSKKRVNALIKQVSSHFTEDINMMPVSENRVCKIHNFNYSVIKPRYITVFTYDLYNGSRTIWGKDFIETFRISNESIDEFEAKRLVANRIGELIYLKKTNIIPYTKVQWKGKVVLAIGSAWLICKKKYVSSYRGQYDTLKKVSEDIDHDIGPGFFSLYEKAFNFLRENIPIEEISDKLLKDYVKGADFFFQTLGLNRPKINNLARTMKYYKKYIKWANKYGLFGFEDRILQSLISGYYREYDDIDITARIWKEVLY